MNIVRHFAPVVACLSLISQASCSVDENPIEADESAEVFQPSRGGVELTEAAAREIQVVIDDLPESTHLLVDIAFDPNCKGYSYEFIFIDTPSEERHVVMDSRGIRLAVENSDLGFLDGTVIDFLSSTTETGFKFRNPNEQALADYIAASQDITASNE